jgi:hypothetical protein
MQITRIPSDCHGAAVHCPEHDGSGSQPSLFTGSVPFRLLTIRPRERPAQRTFLGSLKTWTLTRAFLEWIRRLERCTETDGDSLGQPKINILVVNVPFTLPHRECDLVNGFWTPIWNKLSLFDLFFLILIPPIWTAAAMSSVDAQYFSV